MTRVFMACTGGHYVRGTFDTAWTHGGIRPNALLSFAYKKISDDVLASPSFERIQLDSGAFSAYNSGKSIDIVELTEWINEMRMRDDRVREAFALDVVRDPVATMKNVEWMWERGCHVIPTFHYTGKKPRWDILEAMLRDYPKIALGGVARAGGAARRSFMREFFRRVWPKPVHGLAATGEDAISSFPFHSVDSASWTLKSAFGGFESAPHNKKKTRIKYYSPDLRAEVEVYMERGRRAECKFKTQMAMLDKTLDDAGYRY